ncbi:hypothetical protein ABK040_009278 [Willaertia magna]
MNEIRYNSSGYRQYKVSNSSSNLNNSNNNVNSNNEGNDYNNGWKYTHRRVAEKIVGRNLLSSEQVHHINKNKTDNRRNNLAVIDRDIHGYLHQSETLEQKACFRCGHTSHYASDCFAKRDVFDRTIVGGSKSTVYYNNNSDSVKGMIVMKVAVRDVEEVHIPLLIVMQSTMLMETISIRK